MTNAPAMDTARYELSFRPQWDEIELVRKSVALCAQVVFADSSAKDMIAMATAELLENAVKHGDVSKVPITYGLAVSPASVVVTVSNAFTEPGSAQRLRETIDWIRSFAGARQAYEARMQQIFSHPEPVDGGLGLVRVAHEAQCALSCHVDAAAKRVEVSAAFQQIAPAS